MQPWTRRRGEEVLAGLGLETALDTAARLESEGHGTPARALRAWVNRDLEKTARLVAMLPPSSGHVPREVRIGLCGVAIVAMQAGLVGYVRRACKDRFCPDCGARRRRRFVARLREIVAERQADPAVGTLYFVTLTQPKRWRESPSLALDRVLEAFKRFRYHAREFLVGGVRSLEVTSRKAGTKVGAHTVKVAGVHAHLHCILEVKPGTSTMEIWRAWAASCRGAAEVGFDAQLVDDDNVYQVGDYVVDTSGLVDLVDDAPEYVRRVLHALHGRRLVSAIGAWRRFDLGLRESKGNVVFGDRTVYRLATKGPEDYAVRFADGSELSAADTLAKLLEGPRRPFSGEAASIDAEVAGLVVGETPSKPARSAVPRGPP